MRYATLGARVLLGLIFVVFGLNGFLNFIPVPPQPPEGAAYIGAIIATGLFPIVKGIEVVAGLMVLSGLMVPLGLVLLAPIIVVIAHMHLTTAPAGLPMVGALLVFELFLAWRYKAAWAQILKIGTPPSS